MEEYLHLVCVCGFYSRDSRDLHHRTHENDQKEFSPCQRFQSKVPEIFLIFSKINRNYSAEGMNSWIKTEDLSFIFYLFFFFTLETLSQLATFVMDK